MSWIRRLVFYIMVLTLGLSSAQGAPRCESIFLPGVWEVLQTLDKDNHTFLFQGSTLENFSKDFSWLRRRKLRKLVNDTDLQSLVSTKSVERFAVELGTVLFGKRETLDRWLRQDKETRLEESTVLLIKEKLLQEGLIKTWADTHDPRDAGAFRRGLDRLRTWQDSRVMEILRIPWALPTMKNKEAPPDLMYKIIRDGFKEHAEEARVALKAQTKIEAYNTFRRIYGVTFFSIVMIFNSFTAYEHLQELHKQQVQEVVQQLQETRKAVEETASRVKQEQFEAAYQSAEQDFIAKWGEPPTASERQVLRARIAEALNIQE